MHSLQKFHPTQLNHHKQLISSFPTYITNTQIPQELECPYFLGRTHTSTTMFITTCSSIVQLQHKSQYIINIAYFSTKATTKKMATSRTIVTFTHPHMRQMKLPMPSLFLLTISCTLFRFCSKLSIFFTSSGTSVVEPAAMVEDADGRCPLS